MGATISAIGNSVKKNVHYALTEREEEAPWRYPYMDLELQKFWAAHELDQVVEEISTGLIIVRWQVDSFFRNMKEAVLCVMDMMLAAWRMVYCAGMMMDEVGVRVVQCFDRVPPVVLELLERAKESFRAHMPAVWGRHLEQEQL